LRERREEQRQPIEDATHTDGQNARVDETEGKASRREWAAVDGAATAFVS
jgi:hypothetical protein